MNVLRQVIHESKCKCENREQHAKALEAVKCRYHAFATVEDWGYDKEIKYPELDGTYFKRSYKRLGYPDYSFLTLGDAE